MKHTKLLVILLIALLAVILMAGCGADEPTTTSVNVGTLRGPAGMGMAPLMYWAEDGQTDNDYTFTLSGTPEEMVAGIVSGQLDIAAVPVNLAAVLYARTEGDVQIISALTQSVLFVLDSTGTINSVEDLRGQTIHLTGQGASPQFTLEHILRSNGLEPGVDVDIVFNAEHAELAALMVAGEVSIGLLPQPFATSVLNQSDEVEIALDLAAEWDKASPGSVFVQSSVVARAGFVEEHPDAVETFLQEHAASLAFVSEHVDQAAELMEQFDIVPAGVARQVIPISNFVYLFGPEMQHIVDAFLTVLYDANPDTVGGTVPGPSFYFVG